MAVWDSEKLVKQREKIRKRGSRIGIRWKVFSYLMLFLVILLVILWCFQVVFFGNIYKRIKTGEIMARGGYHDLGLRPCPCSAQYAG